MSMNSNFFLLSVFTSTGLFLLSVLLYSHRPVVLYTASTLATNEIEQFNLTAFLALDTNHTLTSPFTPLVAILPVTPASFHSILDLLEPFLKYGEPSVREVVIVCPASVISDVRLRLQNISRSVQSVGHPDISVLLSPDSLEQASAVLRAAADTGTDSLLVMDDEGLKGLSEAMHRTLLRSPALLLPFGPKGAPLSTSQSSVDTRIGRLSPAEYLVPPFVAPAFLLSSFTSNTSLGIWADLGKQTATYYSHPVGGLLLEIAAEPSISAQSDRLMLGDPAFELDSFVAPVQTFRNARFIFFLPTLDDLRRATPLICSMSRTSATQVTVLVYDEMPSELSQQDLKEGYLHGFNCVVKYDILTGRLPPSFTGKGSKALHKWLNKIDRSPTAVLSVQEMDSFAASLRSKSVRELFHGATMIEIPRNDLDHSEWMTSLSAEEWKNWHTPRIDICVITKDRAQSLSRLFDSLSTAPYFGDSVGLRINIEQDSDTETLDVVSNLSWPFGHTYIHRRVIHGGLLPAVLESWYPHNDDSYGVLLEDDVEVSPFFYAWIKMAILRYRYGEATDRNQNLFGVSLYQQKHLELPLGGRQAFDPRSLFSKAGLRHPNTPYLSQVPCSWGAVYFPEHWRDFHDYLSFRLAEHAITIEDNVVEDVRSNHWSNSWKRYFIELVYLRGYVMLYPNFEDFLSLSTNHLEVGSHVKVRSAENEELFSLPLLQLQKPGESCRLLELPHGRLPGTNLLPVLNLTGSLTSLEEIKKRGISKRENLFTCESPTGSDEDLPFLCAGTWKIPEPFD